MTGVGIWKSTEPCVTERIGTAWAAQPPQCDLRTLSPRRTLGQGEVSWAATSMPATTLPGYGQGHPVANIAAPETVDFESGLAVAHRRKPNIDVMQVVHTSRSEVENRVGTRSSVGGRESAAIPKFLKFGLSRGFHLVPSEGVREWGPGLP